MKYILEYKDKDKSILTRINIIKSVIGNRTVKKFNDKNLDYLNFVIKDQMDVSLRNPNFGLDFIFSDESVLTLKSYYPPNTTYGYFYKPNEIVLEGMAREFYNNKFWHKLNPDGRFFISNASLEEFKNMIKEVTINK